MGIVKRVAAVVVPLGLVVGGVWYGVSRHDSGDEQSICSPVDGDFELVTLPPEAPETFTFSGASTLSGMLSSPRASKVAFTQVQPSVMIVQVGSVP